MFDAALGTPIAFRAIWSSRRLIAAIGRWRHHGAYVDLAKTRTTQLVFNMTSGQQVERRDSSRAVRTFADAGDVALVQPSSMPQVRISGDAGTLQVILSPDIVESAACNASRHSLDEPTIRGRLQALGSQALVTLAMRSVEESRFAGLVEHMAVAVAARSPATTAVRGGLSPAAKRRVQSLLDRRLDREPYTTPTVQEMAAIANLSLFHFIRAFHAGERQTPHAWVTARRFDLALRMLIEGGRVDEIADRVGFSSSSHFVSAFRRSMGVMPALVRDAAR